MDEGWEVSATMLVGEGRALVGLFEFEWSLFGCGSGEALGEPLEGKSMVDNN